MNTISAISLSGMNAAQTRMQAAAHNIANLNTPVFKRLEVTQNTLAEGGTRAEIVRTESAGANLEADMVQQLLARNSFLSNLLVFKSSEAVLGSLLDITA